MKKQLLILVALMFVSFISLASATITVNLNSPSNGATVETNLVNFDINASTDSGTIKNVTLYTNETGSWQGYNESVLGEVSEDQPYNAFTDTGTSATNLGMVFTVDTNVTLSKVGFPAGKDWDKAWLYFLNGTVISSTTVISGQEFVFSGAILRTGNTYIIGLDDTTGDNDWVRQNGVSYPQDTGIVTWTAGWSGAQQSTQSFNIDNITLINSTTGFSGIISRTYPSGEKVLWNAYFCDTSNTCNFSSSNYTFTIDNVAPSITLNYPTSLIDYGANGETLEFNWTVTDTNLDKCWYNYNGTNYTAVCSSGTPIIKNIPLQTGNKNITFYANDTAGNLNTSTFSWDYKVFQNSITYNSITLEGSIESFVLNLTVGSGIEVSDSNFYYNGTNYGSSSISSSGSNRILSITNFEIPDYSVDVNVSFYWNLILNDATVVNTSAKVQQVNVVELDNCASYTNQIFNLSLFDEQELTSLNGTVQLFFDILNENYESIKTYTFQSNNTHNTLICSDSNITSTSSYYSAEIRYGSEGYATELYHIQRAIISDNANVSLYPLNLNSSTEFKLTYQDNTFNFVEGAIIQLQRKYIGEDIFRVVEAPLTSSEGIAVVHIDLDSVKYRATVVKNGVVLDTFENLVFKCQSELTGECEQKLLGTINPQNIISYDNARDFVYSVTPGSNNITVSFSVPSTVPATINIQLTQSDQFGNSTLCNQTIVSSSGSISCGFNDSITVSYLSLKIFKNGNLVGSNTYIIDTNKGADFFDNNYIFVVVLILSLVGMALTSPEWIVVNSIVVLLFSGMIWLINGVDFVMGLGILMWLLIAAGIIILKLAKQEDR